MDAAPHAAKDLIVKTLALLLLLAACGCGTRVENVHLVGYSPHETQIAQRAADLLGRETDGRASLVIDDSSGYAIVKGTSDGGTKLGFTDTGAKTVTLWPAAFADDSTLLRVFVHEMMHVEGCSHVEDPAAIMYWQLTPQQHGGLNATDLAEVTRVLGSP